MVIAGKIRGNAPQLGRYLLAQGENERITILDVDGMRQANVSDLRDTLYSMELNGELTRSRNSVYHAYINPNPEDTTDRAMTMEEWQQSVEILTKQLGYEDQRRIVVLHEKPGNRVHAHIVYERYNHERGVMATYEDNYKAHDRARAEMERKLSHKPTPQKNKNHDRHKQTLTEIWRRTDTAGEFINEAQASGYKIAKGINRPYHVIDADGISFDLVRKLDGIKTKDVKDRFGELALPEEKQAIRDMQAAKKQQLDKPTVGAKDRRSDVPQQQIKDEATYPASPEKTPALKSDSQADARQKFLQNIQDIRERSRSLTREITLSVLIALRVCFSFKGNADEQRSTMKQRFFAGAHEITVRREQKPPDRMLGFIEAAQFYRPT